MKHSLCKNRKNSPLPSPRFFLAPVDYETGERRDGACDILAFFSKWYISASAKHIHQTAKRDLLMDDILQFIKNKQTKKLVSINISTQKKKKKSTLAVDLVFRHYCIIVL